MDISGTPWFVAADTHRVLGLAPHNGSYMHHLGRLGPDELSSMSDLEVKAAGKGMASARLVSESGLYKLVMRSDKPGAREFQEWVTRHVLPAIRKDGMYVSCPSELTGAGPLRYASDPLSAC